MKQIQIKSRCSFETGSDNEYDVNSDTDEMQRRVQIALPSSGYGTWKTKSVGREFLRRFSTFIFLIDR